MQVQECPQCGAPANDGAACCAYCRAVFVVETLSALMNVGEAGVRKYLSAYRRISQSSADDAEAQVALGLCYLRLGTYDLAQQAFMRAVETSPDSHAAYFYAACATARGKKLRLVPYQDVKRIEEYLNAALALAPDNVRYKALMALVKHDCYRLNGLRVLPPSEDDIVCEIASAGASAGDIEEVLSVVRVSDETFAQGMLTGG